MTVVIRDWAHFITMHTVVYYTGAEERQKIKQTNTKKKMTKQILDKHLVVGKGVAIRSMDEIAVKNEREEQNISLITRTVPFSV